MGPLIPPVLDFWWHLPWVSKPGWIPFWQLSIFDPPTFRPIDISTSTGEGSGRAKMFTDIWGLPQELHKLIRAQLHCKLYFTLCQVIKVTVGWKYLWKDHKYTCAFRVLPVSEISVKNEGNISISGKSMECRDFIRDPKEKQKILRKLKCFQTRYYDIGFIVLHVRDRCKVCVNLPPLG